MTPQRIQLKRTKGWRMPENTVVVSRPSKWGNPFKVGDFGYPTAQFCVARYRQLLKGNIWSFPTKEDIQRELRGKNLACWCPLVDKDGNKVPCHADVLLEIANATAAMSPDATKHEAAQ